MVILDCHFSSVHIHVLFHNMESDATAYIFTVIAFLIETLEDMLFVFIADALARISYLQFHHLSSVLMANA